MHRAFNPSGMGIQPCLASLCQGWTNLSIKKLLTTVNLSLPWHSLRLLPLLLS